MFNVIKSTIVGRIAIDVVQNATIPGSANQIEDGIDSHGRRYQIRSSKTEMYLFAPGWHSNAPGVDRGA